MFEIISLIRDTIVWGVCDPPQIVASLFAYGLYILIVYLTVP